MQELSPLQARKIILHSQGIVAARQSGAAAAARVIRRLGYVQIDTISVVMRAHHHTLWNRLKNYQPRLLDKLVADKKIFEYWSHAAAYLPIEDFRYSLPRKQAIANGQTHWFKKNHKLTADVKARIRDEGPLQAKDFQQQRRGGGGWWEWKPAKQALEQLFMEGELMVASRRNFQKVYDLTERVLPADIDTKTPDENAYADYLIRIYLQSNGLVSATQAGYLRTGYKAILQRRLQELHEDGQLQAVKLSGSSYYTDAASLALLHKPLSRKSMRLLSPFDNLIIQRKWLKQIFEFDYQIECYVPAAKRQHGYFVMPILWGGEFVARLDAKADRDKGVFFVNKLVLEPGLKDTDGFQQQLQPLLQDYAEANGCSELRFR